MESIVKAGAYPPKENGKHAPRGQKDWRALHNRIKTALSTRNALAHHKLSPLVAIYTNDETGDFTIGEIKVGVTMSDTEMLRKRCSSPVSTDKEEVEAHIALIDGFARELENFSKGEMRARLRSRA